jgi:RimJ/RimL family protein N-acetyltransferase
MPRIEIPLVETERLLLRPFTVDDVPRWADIITDEETGRYIGGPYTRDDAFRSIATYLGHWDLRGYGQWAVCLRSGGRLLGRCGLWFPDGWPELEVGWTFDRGIWGHGYATEAGRAAMEWGFETLGLTRLASVIARENVRSRRVAERLGMTVSYEKPLSPHDDPVVVYAIER